MSERECRDCHEVKLASEFWRSNSSPDGLAYYCKACSSQRDAESARRRAQREGRSMRPFRGPGEELPEGFKGCPDRGHVLPLEGFPRNKNTTSGYATYRKPCQKARSRESRERVHGGGKHYHLKRRCGLGADEVEAKIKEQFGVCPICLTPNPQHVDHDHVTGKVRSVLCFNCNGGLGQFKDNPELLHRAADYVEGNVWKPTLVAPGVYQLPS
jgi:hypothetical protein